MFIFLLILLLLIRIDNSYEYHNLKMIKMSIVHQKKDIKNNNKNFNRIYNGIKYYKDKYNNNSIIPYNYIIPEDNDTIKNDINNLKLGNIISRMKNRGDYKEYHYIIEEQLGFSINLKNDYNNNNYSTLINALMIYHNKFDNLNITSKYIIPNDETWPLNMRGMHLGSQVDHLRRKKRLLERIDDNKGLFIITIFYYHIIIIIIILIDLL
jgi:hypothetical protein